MEQQSSNKRMSTNKIARKRLRTADDDETNLTLSIPVISFARCIVSTADSRRILFDPAYQQLMVYRFTDKIHHSNPL